MCCNRAISTERKKPISWGYQLLLIMLHKYLQDGSDLFAFDLHDSQRTVDLEIPALLVGIFFAIQFYNWLDKLFYKCKINILLQDFIILKLEIHFSILGKNFKISVFLRNNLIGSQF